MENDEGKPTDDTAPVHDDVSDDDRVLEDDGAPDDPEEPPLGVTWEPISVHGAVAEQDRFRGRKRRRRAASWLAGTFAMALLAAAYLYNTDVLGWFRGGPATPVYKRSAGQAGEDYARGSNQDGCLLEALRRHAVCRDKDCRVLSSVFVDACLANTAKSPGFCRSVPAATDRAASGAWWKRMCRDRVGGTEYCDAIFEVVQIHCHER